MSRNYKFHNSEGLYFVSFATVFWVDVFVRRLYFDCIVQNLNYCVQNKGMEIYAWCIMPSHAIRSRRLRIHMHVDSVYIKSPQHILSTKAFELFIQTIQYYLYFYSLLPSPYMKKILLLLTLLSGFAPCVIAQSMVNLPALPIDSITNQVTYATTAPAGNINKDILYKKVKEWATNNFKNAQNVVRLDDQAEGSFILKGLVRDTVTLKYIFTIKTSFDISFTMTFCVSDGKFSMTINDLFLRPNYKGWKTVRPGSANSFLSEIDTYNKNQKNNYTDDDDSSTFRSKRNTVDIHSKMLSAMDKSMHTFMASANKVIVSSLK